MALETREAFVRRTFMTQYTQVDGKPTVKVNNSKSQLKPRPTMLPDVTPIVRKNGTVRPATFS